MAVDVLTEVEIARPRGEVATYASGPDNATAWYENLKTVEWRTASQALSVGARIAFTPSSWAGGSATSTRSSTSFLGSGW